MSVDSAFQRLRDANPVPNPELLTEEVDLDVLFSQTPQRSEAMQTQETETRAPRQKSPRRGLIAAVATVTIAVIIGLMLHLPGTEIAEPSPADVVTEALEAWSNGDSETFFGLVADDAWWYNLPLDRPENQDTFNFAWDEHIGLGSTFSDYECAVTGEVDDRTGGEIVECAGLFSDALHEAFGEEPSRFTGRNAVAGGQIINAMALEIEPPDWIEFFNNWMGLNYGQEMYESCEGPSATGEACADVGTSHLDEAVAAWEEQG